jgi:hypothetical protein
MNSNERDLRHFLDLASAQLRHRMKQAGGDQKQISRIQLLAELIKEQVPAHGGNEATPAKENTGSAARATR